MRPPPLPLLLWAALSFVACERRTPAPPPSQQHGEPAPAGAAALPPPAPPEPAVVPRGCDINLAGSFRLEKRAGLRYVLEDDGTHVLVRPQASDAGDPGAPAMTLSRTPRGFVGLVTGFARSPGGVACPVSFRAEVVACTAEQVTVRTEDAVDLDDRCQLRGVPGTTTDKVLVRE